MPAPAPRKAKSLPIQPINTPNPNRGGWRCRGWRILRRPPARRSKSAGGQGRPGERPAPATAASGPGERRWWTSPPRLFGSGLRSARHDILNNCSKQARPGDTVKPRRGAGGQQRDLRTADQTDACTRKCPKQTTGPFSKFIWSFRV